MAVDMQVGKVVGLPPPFLRKKKKYIYKERGGGRQSVENRKLNSFPTCLPDYLPTHRSEDVFELLVHMATGEHPTRLQVKCQFRGVFHV
ncbi:Uncharacterised protein [Mycobacteroides abscessus]|nr:Uncharacterised protein [Mycobacteroides abscessus]SHW04156.1 Uncharacterised protein [Mycobacteroides abscessus subsp. abscessus]SKD64921.1 Uncharacterised protein [Mycobacteroides abscessus subsp. massiliense]CPR69889.1 Uncharacterised protein [Mycobacteroides abscessus]CPR82808.1 Uncharacterised protein [Mycobacteroides abscessus]